jgi:hypothetical protein
MEYILVAEGHLQKCLGQLSLDVGEETEELEMARSIDGNGVPDVRAAREALSHAMSSATDREKKVNIFNIQMYLNLL